MIVVNHLGDADAAILLAALPVAPEAMGKIELYDFPVLGRLMDWYGIIWLHRGQPDRKALRCALELLAKGRFIIIAPEGRYTLGRGLEEGGRGAAYLALKAKVPILPIALTGTENANVYGNLRKLKRPRISLRVGDPFYLKAPADDHDKGRACTLQVMESIAHLLPSEYRGVYS